MSTEFFFLARKNMLLIIQKFSTGSPLQKQFKYRCPDVVITLINNQSDEYLSEYNKTLLRIEKITG